jgi:hypothetical protein
VLQQSAGRSARPRGELPRQPSRCSSATVAKDPRPALSRPAGQPDSSPTPTARTARGSGAVQRGPSPRTRTRADLFELSPRSGNARWLVEVLRRRHGGAGKVTVRPSTDTASTASPSTSAGEHQARSSPLARLPSRREVTTANTHGSEPPAGGPVKPSATGSNSCSFGPHCQARERLQTPADLLALRGPFPSGGARAGRPAHRPHRAGRPAAARALQPLAELRVRLAAARQGFGHLRRAPARRQRRGPLIELTRPSPVGRNEFTRGPRCVAPGVRGYCATWRWRWALVAHVVPTAAVHHRRRGRPR